MLSTRPEFYTAFLNKPLSLFFPGTDSPLTDTAAAEIVILTEDTVAQAGNTLLLTCVGYGVPSPVVTWLKDGVLLTNDSQTNIYVQEIEEEGVTFVQSILEICDLDAESDTGTYYCVASNENGTDTQSLEVSVESEG